MGGTTGHGSCKSVQVRALRASSARILHVREIPKPKTQIPNQKRWYLGGSDWDLGFGIWDLDPSKHTPGTLASLARRTRPLARKRRHQIFRIQEYRRLFA